MYKCEFLHKKNKTKNTMIFTYFIVKHNFRSSFSYFFFIWRQKKLQVYFTKISSNKTCENWVKYLHIHIYTYTHTCSDKNHCGGGNNTTKRRVKRKQTRQQN
ncbi:unnamed protein product [Ceratitis capitata]|uniref:(Mediterranean fruit fly) hypothetical protein n=1 Tax=Ceratitis capitata TaxID=7213 RepID=A0A811UGN3_CERCA|nr:unnamed protein product [Ceratitis capitata]